MSNIKLTYEQEANILFYIENYLGKPPKQMDRKTLYEIFNYFNSKEGRGEHVCQCLDKDTVNKVSKMIDSYTFSDEMRESPRFHSLLPHLALVKEEAKEEVEVVDNVGIDMSQFLKKEEPIAKSVPVKPTRKKRVTKKKG